MSSFGHRRSDEDTVQAPIDANDTRDDQQRTHRLAAVGFLMPMKIQSVETIPISVPLVPIEDGRQHPLGIPYLTYCLVRVTSDTGLVGWGEISDGWGCEYAQVADAIVTEALGRFILDQDPRDTRAIVNRMWAWLRRRQGTQWLIAQAVSGVEIALWDLTSKAEGVSIIERLGGAIRDAVPVYASGHFLGQATPQGHAEHFAPFLERGVRTVKVRLGPEWRAEMVTLQSLNDLLSEDVRIAVDGSEAFSSTTALQIVEQMAGLRVAFFEEPTPRSDTRAVARLVQQSEIPIAYGEHIHRQGGFLELHDTTGADVWQPDVTVCGGMLEALAINGLASALDKPISPHSATTPLGFVANLHAASTASTLSVMEYSASAIQQLVNYFEAGEELSVPALDNGALTPPRGLGLGIRPRIDELVADYPYRPPSPIANLPSVYTGSV